MFPAGRYPCTYTSSSCSSNITTPSLGSASSQIANTGADIKCVRILNLLILGSGQRKRKKIRMFVFFGTPNSNCIWKVPQLKERDSCKLQPLASHRFFLISEKNIFWLIKVYRTCWILSLAMSNGQSLIFHDHKLHLWWAEVSFAEKCITKSIFKISKPLMSWC